MTLERYYLIPAAMPEEHDLVVLPVLPEGVSIDTAAIQIIGGQTQQIDVELPTFFDDDDLAVDDVVRDDDVLRDEQPPAPGSARELAVAVDEGLQT